MKKLYETPNAEKIEFQYSEQVVASNTTCESVWVNIGPTDAYDCTSGDQHLSYLN